MSVKTVPFSVRITEADAEFLSQYEIEGAKTPSDKFRAILAEKRTCVEEPLGYQGWFERIEQLLKPMVARIRSAEVNSGKSSEIVKRSFEWLPDLMAFFMSKTHHEHALDAEELISTLEVGLQDRISQVHEGILQMGASGWQTCVDAQGVESRIEATMKLSGLIQEIINREKESNHG